MVEVVREYVTVPGPRRLSGELAYGVEAPVAACLLVGPHPYMGGRMDNNVLAALADALPDAGVATLRFEYSGVGASEGSPVDVAASMAEFWTTGVAPVDPLMVEDSRAAQAWLHACAPGPLFLVGYSFGAYVAWAIAPRGAAGLVLISPTIERHTFGARAPGVPLLVIRGENDFATSEAGFDRWLAGTAAGAEVARIDGGQHFFIGREGEVARRCAAFIGRVLADARGGGR